MSKHENDAPAGGHGFKAAGAADAPPKPADPKPADPADPERTVVNNGDTHDPGNSGTPGR